MPKESFCTMALFGNVEALKKELQQSDTPSLLVNQLDKDVGDSPLLTVIMTESKNLGVYQACILLLENGADPFRTHPTHFGISAAARFEYGPSPFVTALFRGYLALIRLMLWYSPNYEDLEIKFWDVRRERDVKTTAKDYAEAWDRDEESRGKGRGFAECIQSTANDAKEVKRLQREAEFSIIAKNYKVAALSYGKIAALYAKHEQLEKTLTYYSQGIEGKYNATVEQYRSVFENYYKTKKLEFLSRAYENYMALDQLLFHDAYSEEDSIHTHAEILNQLIDLAHLRHVDEPLEEYAGYKALDRLFSSRPYVDQFFIDTHARVLDRLIELARVLRCTKEHRSYLKRAAELRFEKPESPALIAERHASSADIFASIEAPEDIPLLAKAAPIAASAGLFRRSKVAVDSGGAPQRTLFVPVEFK